MSLHAIVWTARIQRSVRRQKEENSNLGTWESLSLKIISKHWSTFRY